MIRSSIVLVNECVGCADKKIFENTNLVAVEKALCILKPDNEQISDVDLYTVCLYQQQPVMSYLSQ